jgi:hypothetical protein
MKTLKEFASKNSIGGPGSAPDGWKDLRTLTEFTKSKFRLSQGVALGWNLRTPSAFLVSQICIYLWESESKLYHFFNLHSSTPVARPIV